MSTKPLSSGLISVQSICTEAQGEAQHQSVQITAFLALSGTLLSTEVEEKLWHSLTFHWFVFIGIISKHQDGTVISNILVTLKWITIWDKINYWLIDIIYVTKIFFSSVRPLQMTSDTSTLNCPTRNKLLSNWNGSVDHSPGLLFCIQNMGSIQ